MNTKISKLVLALNEVEINSILSKFKNASLSQNYLQLIRTRGNDNLSTRQIVELLYPNFDPKEFSKYENRFYKLRKKLFDELMQLKSSRKISFGSLTKEEKEKEECRTLISSGKFNEAEARLSQLIKICYENNIFELLPELIDMLIQTKHALNKFKETEKLYKEFRESIILYTHIFEAKVLVKKIYEYNLREGIKATDVFFKELGKFSRTHPDKPRFKLIYNFVAGYYKAGAGGKGDTIKSNVINRHIQLAKKIMIEYPKIPVVNYILDYEYSQNYRLAELEAMIDFRSFRFKQAADKIYKLLKDVLNSEDFLKRMLSEILISNAIHMQIAALNKERALECVQIYLKFIRDNNLNERLPRVYCELASVVSTLGIKESFITKQKLMQYVLEYENSTENVQTNSIGSTLFLKLKMLWLLKDYSAALKIIRSPEIKTYFNKAEIADLVESLLQTEILEIKSLEKIKDLKSRWIKLKYNSKKAEDVLLFNWLGIAIENLTANSYLQTHN